MRWLKARYEPTLRIAIRRRGLVLAGATVATVAALMLGNPFGNSFLPEFNEGSFTVFLMAPPGTSLQESNRVANSVETRPKEIDGVRSAKRRLASSATKRTTAAS